MGKAVFWITGDAGALGVITAALIGWLPPITAVFAIFWYVIQITESQTIQGMLRTRRLKKLFLLRSQATALELLLQTKNIDLAGLVAANRVHAAAFNAAAAITTKKEHMDRVREEAKDAVVALKQSLQDRKDVV